MEYTVIISKIKSRVKTFLVGIHKDIRDSLIKPYSLRAQPYCLHVGCGGVIKAGWVNIDIKKPADLVLDVRNGLPFPDNSSEIVYSEHFLEHLDWPAESIPFLTECYRVLSYGGKMYVGVPDSRYVVEQCLNNLDSFIKQIQENKWGYPEYCQTAFEFINYHFRLQGSHKFAYDLETLTLHLEQVGFRNVKQREFNPSLDSRMRAEGTLYVMAEK